MNELQKALRDIVESGAVPNLAMSRIIFDYAKYHAVLVIISGLLFLLFAFLSLKFWRKMKSVRSLSQKKWRFESKAYGYFFAISIIMGLFMLLLAVANMTNTINPLHGLSLAYNLSQSNGEIYKEVSTDELHLIFSTWIKSGDGNIPQAIMTEIKNRVGFHATRALFSSALLAVFVALSKDRWKKLIQHARDIEIGVSDSKWRVYDTFNFCVANMAIAVSLLMMLVTMANIQGAIAPLTAFLVGFL